MEKLEKVEKFLEDSRRILFESRKNVTTKRSSWKEKLKDFETFTSILDHTLKMVL